MKNEHRAFYREVVQELQNHSLAILAGAGLSKPAGYVNWKELLKDIADDLGLSIEKEYDLISVAQYNVNKIGGRSMLNRKIIDEFNQDLDITDNHKILARLPIHTYWTTNYDDLIEKSLRESKRLVDVKHSVNQLTSSTRRDAIIYKMHGDATLPNEAVITKDDYERYSSDKAPFITALSGDLVSKLFVFIGFSFTDPNLDYILSRVRLQMKGTTRHHYYFIKKIQRSDEGIESDADFDYLRRKQELFIQDLQRFQLQPVYIETYPEITSILSEIEFQFKKKTIFISGSAEEYGSKSRDDAQMFVHKLSNSLIKASYRIVNGFGWGVGSAVINGALEAIYERPDKYSEDQLIVKPFPQFETGSKSRKELWEDYRQKMIPLAGIAIFIFGNKKDDDSNIILADGVQREFEIAMQHGLIPIPIGATGYVANQLYTKLIAEEDKYFSEYTWLLPLLAELANESLSNEVLVSKILEIVNRINR